MKRFFSWVLAAVMTVSAGAAVLPANPAEISAAARTGGTAKGNALDTVYFGQARSEKAHDLSTRYSVKGTDDKRSKEKKNAKGTYTGGGIGEGLTYRQLSVPPKGSEKRSKLEFTLKADPTKQNYLTLRLNGTQQGRGNLLLYGPNEDTTVLEPWSGHVYSELDNGYYPGAPFEGRYYYATYRIPQGLVSSDGELRVSLVATAKFDGYGTSTFLPQDQPSRYIYLAATHTDPFFEPSDNYVGKAVKAKKQKARTDLTGYEYLSKEVNDMMEVVMSWQMYGPEWEAMKNENNAFLDGSVVTYTPLSELKDFKGTKDEWARKTTMQSINFQNWNPLGATTIYVNALMYPFSGDYYQSPELLNRIMKTYDFIARAQDAQGGWCYYANGEDKGKWLGADYDGKGTRLTGERWPLLALGTDYMTQSFIEMDHFIRDGKNKELKEAYNNYLNEKIDGDLTGRMNKTRREWYIEMCAKSRDYLANPAKGDYYNPATRAGTANQDVGFAYDANEAVLLLEESADKDAALDRTYTSKPAEPYIKQLKYKFSEMVDGQKWFSTENKLGLEGGASHGGWAGEYGALILRELNRYAEIGQYAKDPEVKKFYDKLSGDSHDAASYFIYPTVDANRANVLVSECWAGSRGAGYGQKVFYVCGGYTALEVKNKTALRIMQKYIEDGQAYLDPLREDIANQTPHVYSEIIEAQEVLKFYPEVEKTLKDKKKASDYLPMEEEHPDFAWADLDGQVVVFKDKGTRAYVTFNYRRDDWQYNNNVRIHYTTDNGKRDYVANALGINKGGTYTYDDTTVNGETYTHTRYDGFSQVEYDKYIVAINQSKTNKAQNHKGKSYQVDTFGVKKAKDLVSGKTYVGRNGNDIRVIAKPNTAVVLKVLEKAETKSVGVKYISGKTILGTDNINAVVGSAVKVKPESFDGYKAVSAKTKTVRVSADNDKNIVTFRYKKNAAPKFTKEPGSDVLREWKTIEVNGARGSAEYDADGNPVKLTALSDGNNTNGSKFFVYQEATDDIVFETSLKGFANTKTDKDYYSMIIADHPDLQKGNYIELRHFPNNNNILLVSHRHDQGVNAQSYWAGDMNNKAVPIWFRIVRRDDVVSYEYSLDGTTYEKTSKPVIDFKMNDKVYVGVAMTAGAGLENTATISDISITNVVPAAVKTGETVKLNFAVKDADPLSTAVYGFDKEKKASGSMTMKPEKDGNYQFKAVVNDAYHDDPVTKMLQVQVGETQPKEIGDIPDVVATEGDKIRFTVPDAPGAAISLLPYGKAAKGTVKGNTYTWKTKKGQAGIYQVLVTYDYEDYRVTRLVELAVGKDTSVIDWVQ